MRPLRLLALALCFACGACVTRGFAPGRLDGDPGIDASRPDAAIDAATPDMNLPDAAVLCAEPFAPAVLYAVHPPVAEEGQTIWLEGSFVSGSPVTVTFPSGDVVRLCAPAAARFSVVVPAGAGSGWLTTAGGTGRVQFRAVSFRTELSGFHPQYAQTAFARGMPTLRATHRREAVSAATRHFFHAVAGDVDGETGANTLETLRIHSDGALGAAQRSVGVLTNGRSGAASVWIGERFCLIGGTDGAVDVLTVECAPVVTDPSSVERLGDFTVSAGMLPGHRRDAAAVVIGRYVYLLGGTAAGPTGVGAQILRAPLSDGTDPIGAWAVVGDLRVLDDSFAASAAVVVGNTVYVVGLGGTSVRFDVEASMGDLGGEVVSTLAGGTVDHARAIEIGTSGYFIGSASGQIAQVDPVRGLSLSTVVTAHYAQRPLVELIGNELHIVGAGGTERANIVASDSRLVLRSTIDEGGTPVVVGDRFYLVPSSGSVSEGTVRRVDGTGYAGGVPDVGLSISGAGRFVVTPLPSPTDSRDVVTWFEESGCGPVVEHSFVTDDGGLTATDRVFGVLPLENGVLRFGPSGLLELQSSACGRTTMARVFATDTAPFMAALATVTELDAGSLTATYVEDTINVAAGTDLSATADGIVRGRVDLGAAKPSAVYVLGSQAHLLGFADMLCRRGDLSGFRPESCPMEVATTAPGVAFAMGDYVYIGTGGNVFVYRVSRP